MITKNIFQERIKELRIDAGLTQAEVAKETGISQAEVARLEAGLRIPKMDSIISLSKFFNVSSDYLLGLTDEY